MTRFCVFCGEAPHEKNKEHVVPKWLVEMTGDPNRVANFGIGLRDGHFHQREFAFNSLVFPACRSCNDRFARLEETVRGIFGQLLTHSALRTEHWIVLLDWLDKVRVGLWLGYLYLDGNPMGINPSFHIESRLGRTDRTVSIVRMKGTTRGISFAGPQFKGYSFSPTSFALRVNDLWLVNAAGISLCSQRLGFPYLERIRIREDHKTEVSLNHGKFRILNPVERRPQLTKSIGLYQPIFRSFVDSEEGTEYYDSQWVRERSADVRLGYGKIFVQNEGSLDIYPDEPSSSWLPQKSWSSKQSITIAEYVMDRIYQDLTASIRFFSSQSRRRHMRTQTTMSRMVDRAMIRRAKRDLAQQDAFSSRR